MAYNAGGQLMGKADSFSYPDELTKVSTRGSIKNIYRYDAQRGWLNSMQTLNGKIEYS